MTFKYTIRSHKRTRGVRIAVHEGGEVVVTKSPRILKIQAEYFVQRKADWIQSKIEEFSKRPKKLLAHYSVKDFKENKERAYNLVDARIAHFNKFYKYEIERVTIRNQKSRWGSCSRRRALNFNYKIVFLPPELADYIVVHELCHLKEMNHSRNFWALVAQQIPDYKNCRSRIKLF
jgi:predicted metal-dependent hydrolase